MMLSLQILSKLSSDFRLFKSRALLPNGNPFTLSREGWYSLTRPEDARVIRSLVASKAARLGIPTDLIVDATACNGGDTVSFAQSFGHVIAFEKDPINFRALTANIKSFGDRVVAHNADFTTSYHLAAPSPIVYFDPPWGGPDYKHNSNLWLRIEGYDMADMSEIVFDNMGARLVVLKLPSNFDFARLRKRLADAFSVDVVAVRNFFIAMVHSRRAS
jgi:16S rRNA G966 N2-methylase RsmD